MGLEIKQTLKLSQQLVMTPQLQQAIKLLQLSRLELAETINQELMENPMLDLNEESQVDQQNSKASESTDNTEQAAEVETPSLDEVKVEEKVKDDFDWENYLGEYSSAPNRGSGEGGMAESRETPSFENVLSRAVSLRDSLLWQLRMSALNDGQMELGAEIIGNLDADGYLKSSLEAIAELKGVSVEEMEAVLKVVQQFDPLGVASRDIQECLITQAVELFPAEDLVHEILESHLDMVEKGKFKPLAKKLKVSLDEVARAIGLIRKLEPKPGRAIDDDPPHYITPDIYVYKMDGEYVIVLNEDGLPKLKVNNFYKDSLGKEASSEAKEYVQTKLRSALWLIRSIHQRQRTIYKVTESIVKHQKVFLDSGITNLKPLVLRDVAEDVGMHESTISRVTTNKYVHTPQGVYELKFFFNSGINRVHGQAVASEAVKERIAQIVGDEDQGKPLSDQTIAELLKKENIDIARRTVAKYREMLGILPSSRRRRII
ncbi:RNA polymerase factor sigma-54 [Dethiosulfatarculus sandiegensis]|uniref:RNA polymerase sigma54 factor n=1 Tax=Dethiosulfatarculus sandiegensis TaxID=1429043 RepID=A0A0D2J1L8_9BACT|nr:RNA polymerase factor sigma-54 [Dethiosulfatarculus sandiegensis]KIX12104.1 RNA polymerase sigma54 factor [Dethiosulfatarculus sandiegensis]